MCLNGVTMLDLDSQSKQPTSPKKAERVYINRNFALLWLGHTISLLGTRASGLTFVAILILHATPFQLGWLEALSALPALLMSLIAGVWIDRVNKQSVLILSDLGRALLLLSIPLTAIIGTLSISQLYIVALLVATLSILFEIAHQAILPALVSHERLIEGNSKLEASAEIAEMVGPSLGGLLVQMLTAPFVVGVDALTFLVSACFLGSIKTHTNSQPASSEKTPIWESVSEGLRYLFRDPRLRATTLYSLQWNLCGGTFAALYGIYTMRTLHLPPIAFGLLVTMGGVGGFCGAFVAMKLSHTKHTGPIFLWSTLIIGTTALLTPLASGPAYSAVPCLILGQLIGDFGIAIYSIHELSLRQRIVPTNKLGRINAALQFLLGGIGPSGAVIAGTLGEFIDVRTMLFIGASGILLASAWLIFSPLRTAR
jgi:MFS family permease